MKEYIKQMMDSPGWDEFKEIMEKLINNLRNEDLDGSLPAEEYKINDMANKKAIKLVQEFFGEVKKSNNDIKKEKPKRFR